MANNRSPINKSKGNQKSSDWNIEKKTFVFRLILGPEDAGMSWKCQMWAAPSTTLSGVGPSTILSGRTGGLLPPWCHSQVVATPGFDIYCSRQQVGIWTVLRCFYITLHSLGLSQTSLGYAGLNIVVEKATLKFGLSVKHVCVLRIHTIIIITLRFTQIPIHNYRVQECLRALRQ